MLDLLPLVWDFWRNLPLPLQASIAGVVMSYLVDLAKLVAPAQLRGRKTIHAFVAAMAATGTLFSSLVELGIDHNGVIQTLAVWIMATLSAIGWKKINEAAKRKSAGNDS